MWAEDHRSYEQKYKEQICFHMCDLFGVQHINIGLMEKYSVEHTAQKLKELCQRAGKYIIGVEPMPYSGIPDVKTGWLSSKAAAAIMQNLFLTAGTGSALISPMIRPIWLISRLIKSFPSRSTTFSSIPMHRRSFATNPCTTAWFRAQVTVIQQAS